MKKSQRLAAVLLILLMLCGCSMPATPNTVVLPQTPAENHTESAPASAEPAQTTPETNAFHLEYEQTALPEPLSAVTTLTVLDGTFLLGGVSETGLALVRLTAEGKSEELPLPDSTEYLYALCPDGAGGAWLLCGSLPKGYFDAFGNFRFLSKEPEGKLALAHYDAAFALQEIVLLQTQYTDRFFQLCRLEGGFCMMSASLLIRLVAAKSGRKGRLELRGHTGGGRRSVCPDAEFLQRGAAGAAQIRAGYAFCAGGRYLHLGGHRACPVRGRTAADGEQGRALRV